MWNESSSVNLANMVNISATIPEIWNFSYGVTFFGAPCSYCYAQETWLIRLQNAIAFSPVRVRYFSSYVRTVLVRYSGRKRTLTSW